MKVLFITRKWPPAMGGMETWSVEVHRGLVEAGHEVTLHALAGRTGGRTPAGAALVVFGILTAVRILLRRDASHAAVLGGDMAVWPLVWLAGLRAPGAVPTLAAHGTDVAFAERPGMIARLYRGYLRLGARTLRTACVVANSRETGQRAGALGFGRISVIPLGTRMGPPDGAVERSGNLFFAGRLVRRKGLSWFVAEILPRVPEPVRLEVAGVPWDPAEAAALADPRVEYLGNLDPEALARRMAAALAVVVPNVPSGPGHFEGFGLVAVEAAAAGGIVLAPDMEGFRDSVVDGETGLLLPPRDPDAWAEAIARIGGWSADERAAFRARAIAAVRDRYAWPRVVGGLVALWTADMRER